ncbi:MAG TPA: glutamate--tRNA ligase [Syntrophomonadaceae bacterium]|nr:glutamate--tRNA ligase [Syntrophomonadaceae bacterium]HPU49687.1 glutamate--tRNA ligase [Syntrophomonadaceae bacterium]
MQNIRVRFAPSPTGALHIGGARTALFNWLFARNQGGKFILRLEDTDLHRSTLESAAGIIDGLKWLGLDWDEGPDIGGPLGPYRQSDRLPIYQEYVKQLLDNGRAYYCFCTPEELAAERSKAAEEKLNYRHHCPYRELSARQAKELLDSGKQAAVRLKMPESGSITVHDLVRGDVSFDNQLLDDIIIQKSDSWPTYNFAVVVDDYLMQISHVIRAEEHLSNTPKQLHIYDAFGWEPPQFAHVSMILAPDRSKLSKRHGATSVQEFRELGYLPEALINYLALLGWSAGEEATLLSKEELVKQFNLNNVSRSAAIYDLEKLTWMNGNYIAQSRPERLLELLYPQAFSLGWWTKPDDEYALQVVKLLQPRLKTVNQFFEQADYFFNEVGSYEEKGVNKYWRQEGAEEILAEVANIIEHTAFDANSLESAFRQRAEKMGVKAASLIHPTRLALTGRTSSPGLFEVMEVLGKNTCRQRIKSALHFVASLCQNMENKK